MFRKLGLPSLAGLLGLVMAAGTSHAEQKCEAQTAYIIPTSVSCETLNKNVAANASALRPNDVLSVRVNLIKGVDTGVAATRDVAIATGLTNTGLITCTASDFNPSTASFVFSSAANDCVGATVLKLLARDRP